MNRAEKIPCRRSRKAGFDHDHLLTDRQQCVRNRPVGTGPAIQYDGFECLDAEIDFEARVATDEPRDDDRGVIGDAFDFRRHTLLDLNHLA